MKNLSPLFIFALLILSIFPAISVGNNDISEIIDFNPAISGTRAGEVENESVTFTSGDSTVHGNLYYTSGGDKRPAIVFGVGYTAMIAGPVVEITGLFDSSNYGWLGTNLASGGYVVLVVRYGADVGDLNEIFNITKDYSLWINQTRDAITALITGHLEGASVSTQNIVDAKRIALGGHSIGGAVSIVTGALDKRVKCVFAMSPKDLAGSPKMDDHIGDISPVPIQLQVGEEDLLGGLLEVQESYNAASAPKEIVQYRYGTYEGFTDIGKVENIDNDDLPDFIPDEYKNFIPDNFLSTKQHTMSINYTSGFLNYYLENSRSFDFDKNYSEGYTIDPPLLPSRTFDNVWNATVSHQGLNRIFHDVSVEPEILDFAEGNHQIEIRASVTPRGIWETGVEAHLIFPEGAEEHYIMPFNKENGDFRLERNIPINHTLGMVEVIIHGTDSKSNEYSTDPFYFRTTTSSDLPVIDTVTYSPDPMVPGVVITFTVSASDKDGIAYYHYDFNDGNTTGWVESKTQTHTFEESMLYIIRIRVKDSEAQESDDYILSVPVSHRPVARLEVDSSVKKGDSIKFDASASSDEDGDDLKYYFIFGDDEKIEWTSESIVTHVYTSTGDFEISVAVKDSYDLVSEPVNKTIKVKEEDESALESLTSSSGFPFLIIIVIVAIMGGGFFLLRGGEEEEKPKPAPGPGAGKGTEKKKPAPVPPGTPVPSTGASPPGTPVPSTGALPPGTPVPSTGTFQTEGSPARAQVKPPIITSPVQRKTEEGEIPMARPIPPRHAIDQPVHPVTMKKYEKKPIPDIIEMAPEKPESEPREVPSESKKVQPEYPKPPELPKPSEPPIIPQSLKPSGPPMTSEPPAEPEVDAPPVEEESWDDAIEDDERELWDDEDFAIPLALKEKLKKESE